MSALLVSDMDDVPISSNTWENEVAEGRSDELNTSFWGLEGNEQVHRSDLFISFAQEMGFSELTSVKV
jgi:hypothetical protein